MKYFITNTQYKAKNASPIKQCEQAHFLASVTIAVVPTERPFFYILGP